MSRYVPASARRLDLSRSEIMADQVRQLAQCELLINYGLDELDTFFDEDRPELLAFIEDNGYSREDLHQVLEYLHSTGLAQDIQSLSLMLREEIKPILSTVIEDFSDYHPYDDEMSLERRDLSGLFQPREDRDEVDDVFEKGDGHTNPSTSSPHGTSNAEAGPNPSSQKEDFQTFANDPFLLMKRMEKMLSQSGAKIPSHLASMVGGFMGPFAHHRHLKHRLYEEGRRRLQIADDTCDHGCAANMTNAARKDCNCKILFDCVGNLKYTDFAVIFSRGLVDKETGTIEVDVVNYDNKRLWSEGSNILDEDGNLATERNDAIADMFDAIRLLEKIDRVHDLLVPGPGAFDCGAVLDEFHVACEDWNSACSMSDGRSYRMVSKMISRYFGSFYLLLRLYDRIG